MLLMKLIYIKDIFEILFEYNLFLIDKLHEHKLTLIEYSNLNV